MAKTTLNPTGCIAKQELYFSYNPLTELASAAVFCFTASSVQFLSASLAESSDGKATWRLRPIPLQNSKKKKSLMQFLKTLTTTTINSFGLKMLFCRHGGWISAQMVFTTQISWRNHPAKFSIFPLDSATLGRSPNWGIYLLIISDEAKVWETSHSPSFAVYKERASPVCRAVFVTEKKSLYGSIHHYMTEGGGAECTMWDSILSPRRLLFTLGAFSVFFFFQVCDGPL